MKVEVIGEIANDFGDVCKWSQERVSEYVFWESECGNGVAFDDGETPQSKKWKFCPYCGRSIEHGIH